MICQAVAKPDAILRVMRPKTFCQLIQFRLGTLHDHHFAFGSEQLQQAVQDVCRVLKVVQ